MADGSSTQGAKMPEVAPPNLGLPCLLSHRSKEELPGVKLPTPDGWSLMAAELLAASNSDGEPDEVDDIPLGTDATTHCCGAVDDIPLGTDATTPCHGAVLPQLQKQPQQQPCTPRFFYDESDSKVGGAGIFLSRNTSSESPHEFADILCEEALAWEARMQDANARLEEVKEQSERRIRALEFQVSRLSLENTKLKKQLHLGVPEFPRQNNRLAARVPPVSSNVGLPPTPLRRRSTKKLVKAIAETSALTGMLKQFPRSATATSPTRTLTKSPTPRQHMVGFSPEFPLLPPQLDWRWHPAAGSVVLTMVR